MHFVIGKQGRIGPPSACGAIDGAYNGPVRLGPIGGLLTRYYAVWGCSLMKTVGECKVK